jgi:cytochrome P450
VEERRGDRLSEDELVASAILLLMAGNDGATNLIGNAVSALLQHPGQLASCAPPRCWSR